MNSETLYVYLPDTCIVTLTYFHRVVSVQMVMMETVISGISDVWPQVLRKKKALFTFFTCVIGFLLGIPMTTKVRYEKRINKTIKALQVLSQAIRLGCFSNFRSTSAPVLFFVCLFIFLTIKLLEIKSGKLNQTCRLQI